MRWMRGTRGASSWLLACGLAAFAALAGRSAASASPAGRHPHSLPYSFTSPVFLTSPPGDTHRIFVVEQDTTSTYSDIELMVDGGPPANS